MVDVPDQGKGHAVRAIFAHLGDRDALILVDGDGTYPAGAARAIAGAGPGRYGRHGRRRARPTAGAGAMSPVRGLGNVLIRSAFRLLIGTPPGDLLSGYRVFGPRFLQSVNVRSSGFEIETELTSEAIAQGFRVVEIPVSYHPRIAGTASKLRAGRDGARIIATIFRQAARLRPGRLVALGAIGAAAIALVVVLVALAV